MPTTADHASRSRIAKLIRARRGELGLSRQEAASAAKISYGLWAKVEQGASMPGPRYLHAIERALHFGPGSLNRVAQGGDPEDIAVPAPMHTRVFVSLNLPAELTDEAVTNIVEQTVQFGERLGTAWSATGQQPRPGGR